METINSIGFANFWGVTPSFFLFENEEKLFKDGHIRTLITNTNDFHHILKTIYQMFSIYIEKNILKCDFKMAHVSFYVHESFKENIARLIFFFHLFHDRLLSVKERVEIFLEVYGNTLLSSRTVEYLKSAYKILINFMCGDKKYSGVLGEIFDLSLLTHKEKDEIVEVLASYDSKSSYDIEKYRDDRVRFMMKDRYDYRKNLFDWDYHMTLAKFAPIIKLKQYTEFRLTGISFESRVNEYKFPNRTLSSYIPGREKKSKDSCLVRGFWGDIVNSPFIAYGLELETQAETDHFYRNNRINYLKDAQDITEYNLMKMIMKIDINKDYDYLTRELEKDRLREERTKQREEAERQQENDEQEKKADDIIPEETTSHQESQESKTNKIETEPENNPSTQENTTTQSANAIDIDNTIPISQEKKIEVSTSTVTVTVSSTNDDLGTTAHQGVNELMDVFKYLHIKIIPMSGNLEATLTKKNKFKNLFDFILFGFHSKNIFEKVKDILADDGKVLVELNSYMTSFVDKQKAEFNDKLKEITAKNDLLLDDTSSKYIWKFIQKKSKKFVEEEEVAESAGK